MKLTILGIQGCGKGTQAKRIAKEYGIPHISTGDIFRKAMAEQTPLGVEAQGYVNSGNLVPDSLTINLVKERVAQEDCANGYILDGFPRNMAQAEAFEAQLDKAIYIDVDEDTVIKRIKARRTCEKCGEIYSTETYDKAECSKCGGKLIIREDEKSIDTRIQIYKTETFPLVGYLESKGKLVSIDTESIRSKFTEAEDQINGIFNEIKKSLGR
ncbi:MAG: nucleoside monophosphate kinase [Clostridia bacterium]|nr:nucleoside monophosphate kinase [Clostridia bacterium]